MIAVVVTLAVLAATLGAGAYLLYRMLEKRLGEIKRANVELASGAYVALQELVKNTKPQPVGARIQCSNALERVRGLECISGVADLAPYSEGRVVVAPHRCNLFRGTAIRMIAHVKGNASIEQRVEIWEVEINQCPQWDGSGTSFSQRHRDEHRTPIPSDVFAAPPGFAVALKFHADITSEHGLCPLVIRVFNHNPNSVRVVAEVYGKPVSPEEQVERAREQREALQKEMEG